MNNLFDDNIEKVKFKCSIKNCKKGIIYKIIIINKEKSLGDFLSLETNELKSEEDNGNLIFEEEFENINYNFNKRQLITIQVIKKEFKNFEYNYNSYQRLTCMPSLICSKNSVYERRINENDNNSEILSIKVVQDLNFSEILNYSKSSIFEFFNKGSKLKFHFLFDFSNENKDSNEFLKSINIYNDALLYCYNNYHLYTTEDEVYMYGTGAKRINEENESEYFSINSGDNSKMVKSYKNAKKYFINCLNKIKREKNIYIFPFLDYLFDSINNDKKYYNIIFLCLRNLSNENDINDTLDLIKEKNLSMKIVLIHIKDENNINGIKEKISQEDSNIIYIELDSKNELEDKLLYCFQIIGDNISKPIKSNKENNRETIISINCFDDNNNNEGNNDVNENNNDLNINNKDISKKENQNQRRLLNNSFKEDKNENIQNPYKKNDTIKKSENESESTQKEIVTNPYAKMSKENLFSESNQKTDFDSYNNNQNQNSLFGKGK